MSVEVSENIRMDAAPDWELCKENIVPLKRGRPNIAKFDKSKVLASNDDADKEKEFTGKIEKLSQDDSVSSTELLDSYISYYKWVRDIYPSSSEKALKVLEECTYTLNKKDSSNSIKNNIKYVKMWIEYADMVRIPGDIFTFMNSNKIGDRVSLFWIAWAFVAEKAGNHKLTDQIFQKGIKKMAEPKDILQKRYQQFQRRLARHYLNLAENGELDNESDNTSAAKNVLSVRSSGHSGAQSQSNQTLSRVAVNKPATHSTSNSTFNIFNDSSNQNNNLLPENSQWKTLGSENQRKKENEGPLMKFGDGGITNKAAPPTAIPAPSVEVFIDPECVATEQSTSLVKKNKAQPLQSIRQKLDGIMDSISNDPLARHKKVDLISPTANKETETAPSVGANKPTSAAVSTSAGFSIFSEEPKATISSVKPSNKASAVAPTSAGFSIFSGEQPLPVHHSLAANDEDQMNEDLLNELGILDREDGTINTRLARKDIDSMFCSPQESIVPKRKFVHETSIIGGVSLTSTAQPYKLGNNNSMACDISAIKESSREYSIFGSIAITPSSSNKRLATTSKTITHNYSIIEEDSDINISNSM